MVGSRKLSNDEVEALLSGLDEESKDQTAQQFDPNEVREFKFGTEDLSLLGYQCFVLCLEFRLFHLR
jgi:flagellar motor switch protein FliM